MTLSTGIMRCLLVGRPTTAGEAPTHVDSGEPVVDESQNVITDESGNAMTTGPVE